MQDQQGLKVALERMLADSATDADRRSLQHALLAGQIVYTSGDRGVSIGGDASGALIITGDVIQIGTSNQIGTGNQSEFSLGQAAFGQLREKLFPTPLGHPPRFPDLIFLGRENSLHDVKGLLGLAAGAKPAAKQAIVRGWPGVGKTTLVSVLSRDPDVARSYPDGVLWTSLDQKPPLMSILAGWGRTLGRDDLFRIATAEEAVNELRAMLQNRRMLLIVDDVWDSGHGALFQKARSGNCGLIITTRLDKVAEGLAQSESEIYRLPVLAEDDALKLMHILAPTVVSQHLQECRELVQDLEYLPLALHVAARLLRKRAKRGLEVGKLLKDIRQGAAIIEAEAPPDRAEEGNIPKVKALLQKSTDLLSESTRECFAYLGAFAPKPATFDLAAMKSVWEVADAEPIAEDLIDHGLLEPVGGGRFQMHALLVAHAISLCEP
jgi:hypothetical protein